MLIRWLTSRTVREASYLCQRVRKIANAQRDLLVPQGVESIGRALSEVRLALANGADPAAVLDRAANLEAAANKWLRPYPAASLRENVDVMLVALVVALGIRTFFLQPMAIPTGSMQPTLYGITYEDLRQKPNVKVPGMLARLFQRSLLGAKYCHVVAERDDVFLGFEPARKVAGFIRTQRLMFQNGPPRTIWFAPEKLDEKSGLHSQRPVRKGEELIKLKVVSGDRLFVDRLTYNFRRPDRGEIVIFSSQGLRKLTPDTHYIKRLVGLGGEKALIGDDRHLYIDGKRIEATDRGFENLYSFDGPPQENHYSGHLNDATAARCGKPGLAPNFPNAASEFSIPPAHYLFLGDNTLNSSDGRYFDPIPQEKVVGKCAFVFWPVSNRFGWGFR
jgi:signal peptidase I